VQGALAEHELLGADGELGHVALVKFVFGDAEEAADLLARVAVFLGKVVLGVLNKLCELRFEL
jgi:hypothetical protein